MPLERLGPYRISRLLGRGGMGAVYEGVHEETGQHTAIKILSFAFADDRAFRSRFESEIEMLKQLRHPHIVQLIGYGEQDGVMFYSMELVPGSNLHELLARGTRFSWQEVAEIAVQVCSALKHAHDHGVIHRDLKPANLLRTPEGLIKLTDFGIARFFGSTQLTSAGGIIGTADYMSPEQAEGQPVTPRSDLYSLGAVLYSLLTGKPPFPGRSVTEILQRMQQAPPVPVRRLDPQIPEELEAIIQQLLSRDPGHRIPTPLAVSNRLRAMLHGLAARTRLQDLDTADASDGDAPTRVLEAPLSELNDQPLTRPATQSPPPAGDWPEQTVVTRPAKRSESGSRATTPTRIEPPPTRYTEVPPSSQDAGSTTPSETATPRRWQHALSAGGLVALLLLLAAAAWYLSRPPDADTLYQRIQAVAALQKPEELISVRVEMADFLERFPDDRRAAEVRQLHGDDLAHWLRRKLERKAGKKGGAKFLEPLEREYLEAMRNAEPHPEQARERFVELAQREPSGADEREIVTAARHMQAKLTTREVP